MKTLFLAGKVLLIATFGILGMLSLMMFPFLIGDEDTQTSIIGYSYLGLLLISISVIYLIVKNELKPKQTNVAQKMAKF
jgi:uncharacterized membrane protein